MKLLTKKKSKFLALLMAFMMVFSMIPMTAFAEETDGSTETDSNSITAYLTISFDGTVQKAKDETLMVNKEIKVSDKDDDGKYTLYDALVCAHEQYYVNGTSGFVVVDDTTGNSTVWGHEGTDNSLACLSITHGTTISAMRTDSVISGTSTVSQKTIADEQHISIYNMLDGEKITSKGAPLFFNGTSSYVYAADITVPVNTVFSTTLYHAKSYANLSVKKAVCQIYELSADEKKLNTIENAVTDANGVVNLSFADIGMHTIVANTNGMGATALRVHVIDPASVQVSDFKYGTSSDLENDNLIEFDASKSDYEIALLGSTAAVNRPMLYASLTLRENEFKSSVQVVHQYDANGLKKTTGELGNAVGSYAKINETLTWETEVLLQDKYVSDAPILKYTIQIKRIPVLKSLVTNLINIETFAVGQNEYTAYIDKTAENILITATAGATTHSIKINDTKVDSGSEYALPINSLQFNDENKAQIRIELSDSEDQRYLENTYTITVENLPSESIPTYIIENLESAEYVAGDKATKWNVYASASGEVNYQWYVCDSNGENVKAVEGETGMEFTPSTEEAGDFYYFCRVTNGATQETKDTKIVKVKVYEYPEIYIEWATEIPELDEELVTYLKDEKQVYVDVAKIDDKYYGYYYRQGDSGLTELEVKVNVAGYQEGEGQLGIYWSYTQPTAGGGKTNFNQGTTYTPDTSVVGDRRYSVRAMYYFLGKWYMSDYVYVYVYVDEPEVTYPDEITWEGKGTKEEPWLLTNQADMEKLAEYVAEGYNFANTYLELANDITLDTTWSGIGEGNGYESESGKLIKPFSGTLSGAGKYTLTYESGSITPLFNYVREATVENLTIYAPYIANYGLVANYVVDYGEDGSYSIGAGGSYAPGCPDTININNVTLKEGSIIQKAGFIGGGASGGNTVNITNCEAEAGVKIGCNADGTSAGQSNIGTFAGRICGTITNCVSYADVYGEGGIAGIVSSKSQSMGPFLVTNCGFIGTIHATGNYIGGIVAAGYFADSAPNSPCVSIRNCYVAAEIEGNSSVGGIFGGEPGIIQAWSSTNAGYICDNVFYGTVKATSENGRVGGIIGYMYSINRYNVIENNYFNDTCGAQNAIGGAKIVDTNVTGSYEGVTYINTEGASEADLAALDLKIVGNNNYKYIKNADHNRTDDPFGEGKEMLGMALSEESFTDNTVVELLNSSESSFHNWVQGKEYPVLSSEPIVYQLTVSGEYKTEYTIGDELDFTGLELTATWSDGSVTTPSLDDIKIEGYDKNTRGQQTVTLSYGAAKAEIVVTVLLPEGLINVTFSVLGDTVHDSETDGNVHTLAGGNLTTWVEVKEYTVSTNATVQDVLEMVLTENGMTWRNESGNYVKAITKDGVALGEFDNGGKSGWMYTLNGAYSDLGVAQQYLEDGDVIIFHYTDDYTQEKDTTGGSDETKVSPSDVIALIDAIGTVTADSESAINAAREAYTKLDAEQRKEVTNYDILLAAEKALKELKNISVADAYTETGDYLENAAKETTPTVASIGGEWLILGLARSGREIPEGYYDNVVTYVKEHINEAGQLHRAKSTDNSRVILALTAAGYDVTNVGGYNLLEGLTDMDYVTRQGINGPIWALIALDSHDYEIPANDNAETQVTREKLIAAILDAQLTGGGWSLDPKAESADPDMTGMAIQALAPYYNTNAEVKAAIDKALEVLSAMQEDTGAFASAESALSSESTAQVLVALTALGIDPAKDERFIKNGNTIIDGLLTFYVENGGFKHILSGNLDGMATEQGYYALVSYVRMLAGKTSLYDMSDVVIGANNNGAGSDNSANGSGDSNTSGTPSTGDNTPFVLFLTLAAISALGCAVLVKRKREN